MRAQARPRYRRCTIASVSLCDISKVFKTRRSAVRAVHDLSLDVADGSFVVLVGPSGCGKSTTLRLVAGLEQPDVGNVRIGERLVNDVPPCDRDVSMVFQDDALFPHLNIRRNLGASLRFRRVARDEVRRRVDRMAGQLGLADVLDRKPSTLSGGQRQRVAVGRAMVREPKVFLFDEPLAHLDAQLRVHLRTELKAMYQRIRTTMIYVTHDQEEAMTLADRLVVMRDGMIRQVGAPLEVYQCPADRFVAEFIGRPKINCIAGQLRRDHGALHFTAPGGVLVPLPNDILERGGRDDRSVVLGLRAEQTSIVNGDASARGVTSCQMPRMHVTLIEPLGDRLHVHGLVSETHPLVVQVPAHTPVRVGDRLTVAFDPSHMLLFENDPTGRRIAPV